MVEIVEAILCFRYSDFVRLTFYVHFALVSMKVCDCSRNASASFVIISGKATHYLIKAFANDKVNTAISHGIRTSNLAVDSLRCERNDVFENCDGVVLFGRSHSAKCGSNCH